MPYTKRQNAGAFKPPCGRGVAWSGLPAGCDAALRAHFDESEIVEIVEITWVNALEQYFNAIDGGLGIGSDGFCTIAAPEPARAHA
jgi:hypothetical protein